MQWKILSAIAEKTQNGVIVTDAQGSIIWVNKSFESSTGWLLSDVLGKKPKDFLQGEVTDRAKIKRMAEGLAKHEEIDIVVENVNKAGELFYNRLEITPIFDENHALTNFFALQKDVTEDFLRNESNLNEKIFVNEILNNRKRHITGTTDRDSVGHRRHRLQLNRVSLCERLRIDRKSVV